MCHIGLVEQLRSIDDSLEIT